MRKIVPKRPNTPSGENQSILAVPILQALGLIAILLTGLGCTAGSYGWRPNQIQLDLNKLQQDDADPYEQYVEYRQFAIQMTEAYDVRASFNRFIIYGGMTSILGLTTANTGVAAFGHAASAAARTLPIAATFINGLSSIFDNRQLGTLYTNAANKLRRLVAESDSSFLQTPTMNDKRKHVTELQEKVLDIISEVEEGRNAALPEPRKALERAIQAQVDAEEALSIRPKITAVTPSVTDQNNDNVITIQGSGFDSKTVVFLNGVQRTPEFISGNQITLKTPQATTATVYSILVRNRFERETIAINALVQADLKVNKCSVSEKRSNDPTKPVIVLIDGQGFQNDGSLDFQADRPVKSKIWRAHTQWEVELDNSNPGQPITVSKVEATNKRPSNTVVPIANLTSAGCTPIPAAN